MVKKQGGDRTSPIYIHDFSLSLSIYIYIHIFRERERDIICASRPVAPGTSARSRPPPERLRGFGRARPAVRHGRLTITTIIIIIIVMGIIIKLLLLLVVVVVVVVVVVIVAWVRGAVLDSDSARRDPPIV